MKGKTALLFGASGLVGSFVLEELIRNNNYTVIKLFSRKHVDIENIKVIQYVVNFNRPEEFSGLITGDDLFCCIGTTIGKAGSQIAFRNVDYVIPVKLAYIAKKNFVDRFLVVSSIGANKNSNKY
ncbi:MAG: NAD(P)H-binding protein, partial [Ignavibacteria bacterium]|nr:NAD(P)H-binding protein [Ignavibacteria bacterium]